MINDKSAVSVELCPESDNQYDSRAIAFKCYVDNSWTRIEYVVREALDCVHDAIATKRIKSVKFAWAQDFMLALTLQLKESGLVLFVNVVILGNILNNQVSIIINLSIIKL